MGKGRSYMNSSADGYMRGKVTIALYRYHA